MYVDKKFVQVLHLLLNPVIFAFQEKEDTFMQARAEIHVCIHASTKAHVHTKHPFMDKSKETFGHSSVLSLGR